VDYLRNVGVHTLLGVDQNHVGDSRYLDQGVAGNAINATNAGFGCGNGIPGITCAIGGGPGGNTVSGCATDPISNAPLVGAHLCDYAANGLGGGLNATGGQAPGVGAVAFAGINPNFGQILLLEPVGRSVYNALQVVLRSDWKTSLPFVQHMNTQISYSLSRFNSQAQDLDFINNALNMRNPGKFIGPGSLDRTHQLSGGVVMQFAHGIRADFITHWYTALPQSLFFNAPGNAEDIFQVDTQGDGQDPSPTTGAPIPGTNVGSFGRSIKASGLNGFLQSYSATNGNQITPAGEALAAAGLITTQQLQQLCAVTPSLNPINGCATPYPNLQLSLAPKGQVGNDALFTFDTTVGWEVKPIRHWENFSITPNVKFFNLFNHPNYNGPTSLLSGVLDSSVGSVNGTTKEQRRDQGVGLQGLGSGVFSFGAPRVIEFGIKANF